MWRRDVPPFMTVDNPLAVRAVNVVGLKRRDFSAERIGVIREMHSCSTAAASPLGRGEGGPALCAVARGVADGDIDALLDFIAAAKYGIVC